LTIPVDRSQLIIFLSLSPYRTQAFKLRYINKKIVIRFHENSDPFSPTGGCPYPKAIHSNHKSNDPIKALPYMGVEHICNLSQVSPAALLISNPLMSPLHVS
jgi:hypothetical protein